MKILLAIDLDLPASAEQCGRATADRLTKAVTDLENHQKLVTELGSARVLGYYKGIVREPEEHPQRTTHIIAFELSQSDHRLANATLEQIDSLLETTGQPEGPDLGEARYLQTHFATLTPSPDSEPQAPSEYVNRFLPGTHWRWTNRAMHERHPDPKVIKSVGDQAICRDSNGKLFRIDQRMAGLSRQA